MNQTAHQERKLEFYVVNNLRFQHMRGPFEIKRQLTLPQAISLYSSYRPEQISAIGATLGNKMDTDIVQRRGSVNTLVSDYQKMHCWKYNAGLCLSSVTTLIGSLNIRQQMDNSSVLLPLVDRLHIMQLKEGDETRYLRWEGLEAVERMGLKVDMRNYDLVYSEAMRDDESPNQLYRRLNTEAHPAGYRGHSLSMSDVLIYQGKKGCTAYYVDKIGFTLLPRFIRPPGKQENAPEKTASRNRAEEAR
ncbi:MAG: YodL domain-containing protein [Clostridia bacterium]